MTRTPLERYRVTSGKHFRLDDHATGDRADGFSHGEAPALLAERVQALCALQELLYAERRWSLLCVFQAMDAGGKDGTIRAVMSGINPQGVRVTSFKQPGPEDLAHDFLWRVHKAMPERGQIGVFNRSHYEEVLVARVHAEVLARQNLPLAVSGRKIWRRRLQDIAAFERYLARQGTMVLKFFLNVSAEEQRQRLLARLDEPGKLWKFSPGDLAERSSWSAYRDAYEAAIAGTASKAAPWFVVPADHKWYAHLVVADAMIAALEAMALATPSPSRAQRDAAEQARRALGEGGAGRTVK